MPGVSLGGSCRRYAAQSVPYGFKFGSKAIKVASNLDVGAKDHSFGSVLGLMRPAACTICIMPFQLFRSATAERYWLAPGAEHIESIFPSLLPHKVTGAHEQNVGIFEIVEIDFGNT